MIGPGQLKLLRIRHASGGLLLAAVGLLFFGTLFTLGLPVIGVPLVSAGVGSLVLRRVLRDRAVIRELLAMSFRSISLGKLGDAEDLLDEAEQSRASWARRLCDLQRAIIAVRRGDLKAAKASLDDAVARPLERYERQNALFQIEAAHGLRAFVRASLGEPVGAWQDIAVLRERPGASAESLARASLAEAVILARTGERDRLRLLLDRDKALLLENLHPRERAIVRAYQRMVRVATTSAYRVSASREEESTRDEPALVDWVAKVAPSAAPFVRAPKPTTAAFGPPVAALPESAYDARDTVIKARYEGAAATGKTTATARWLSTIGLSLGAILGILGAFVALIALSSAPPPVAPTVAAAPTALPFDPEVAATAFAMLLGATGLGALGLTFRRRLKRASLEELGRLAAARDALGRAQLDAAALAIAPLFNSQHDLVAAHASRAASGHRRAARRRAGDAERRDLRRGPAEPRAGGRRRDAAARADHAARAGADFARPARRGRRGAVSADGRAYPTWERDIFRVRLVDLARAGRFQEAARWVEQNAGDLPLTVRDELLADLVRAVNAPDSAGLGEMERIRDELKSEPAHRRWIELVAPRALAAFQWVTEGGGEEEAAPARLRFVEAGGEHEAEVEMAAEEEQAAPRRAAPPWGGP
ncbi:MAG: hypothetical protein U0359_10545 [Byssovorax sp.]